MLNQFPIRTALLAGATTGVRKLPCGEPGDTGVATDSKLQPPCSGRIYRIGRNAAFLQCRRWSRACTEVKRSPIRTRRMSGNDDASDDAGAKTSAAGPVKSVKTPLRAVPNSRQRVPAKPVAASTSRHAAQTNPAAAKATAQAAKLARRDRVVLEHVPLVKAIAVRVHENLPVHVDLDDLVHAGILGLFDAASKFNPDKQVVFSSYAKHRIKGAILDSLRQLDWASRDMRRRHKQVEAATRDLAAELQRNPTEQEVAAKAGHGRRTLAHYDDRPSQHGSDLGLDPRQ